VPDFRQSHFERVCVFARCAISHGGSRISSANAAGFRCGRGASPLPAAGQKAPGDEAAEIHSDCWLRRERARDRSNEPVLQRMAHADPPELQQDRSARSIRAAARTALANVGLTNVALTRGAASIRFRSSPSSTGGPTSIRAGVGCRPSRHAASRCGIKPVYAAERVRDLVPTREFWVTRFF
jgi:hypothetical protein